MVTEEDVFRQTDRLRNLYNDLESIRNVLSKTLTDSDKTKEGIEKFIDEAFDQIFAFSIMFRNRIIELEDVVYEYIGQDQKGECVDEDLPTVENKELDATEVEEILGRYNPPGDE